MGLQVKQGKVINCKQRSIYARLSARLRVQVRSPQHCHNSAYSLAQWKNKTSGPSDCNRRKKFSGPPERNRVLKRRELIFSGEVREGFMEGVDQRAGLWMTSSSWIHKNAVVYFKNVLFLHEDDMPCLQNMHSTSISKIKGFVLRSSQVLPDLYLQVSRLLLGKLCSCNRLTTTDVPYVISISQNIWRKSCVHKAL